jgi:hypothetical protein
MSTILSTDFMPVKKFSYSSYGLMTYLLDAPVAPLFLGSISIQKISGSGIVAGVITPGNATRAGRVNLQVSEDIYDNLLTVSDSPGAHGVQLTCDDLTLAPIAIIVS